MTHVCLCSAGTIFKRFDPAKLFVLVGQDVTERFHLLLSLCFVVVEVRQLSHSQASLHAQCALKMSPCDVSKVQKDNMGTHRVTRLPGMGVMVRAGIQSRAPSWGLLSEEEGMH